MQQKSKLPLLVGALAFVIFLAMLYLTLSAFGLFSGEGEQGNIPFLGYVVKKMPFEDVVSVKGNVVSSNNTEIECEVKTWESLTIETVVDAGKKVKKGELLLQFNSKSFDEDLIQKRRNLLASYASLMNARQNFEKSDAAFIEYDPDGIQNTLSFLLQIKKILDSAELSDAEKVAQTEEVRKDLLAAYLEVEELEAIEKKSGLESMEKATAAQSEKLLEPLAEPETTMEGTAEPETTMEGTAEPETTMEGTAEPVAETEGTEGTEENSYTEVITKVDVEEKAAIEDEATTSLVTLAKPALEAEVAEKKAKVPSEAQFTTLLNLHLDILSSDLQDANKATEFVERFRNFQDSLEKVLGTYDLAVAGKDKEIFQAQENFDRAKEYCTFSESLAKKGYITPMQLKADRFAVEQKELLLGIAKRELSVLLKHTYKMQVANLDSQLEIAKANLREKEETHVLRLREVEEAIEKIEACRIFAPVDGEVLHANRSGGHGRSEFVVEEGAKVRSGQVVLLIPDPSQMHVEIRISEANIVKIREDQPAIVTIKTREGVKDFPAKVSKVDRVPLPTQWYNASLKSYEAEVKILNPPLTLQDGLTATVKIEVEKLSQPVVAIPTECVVHRYDKFWCFPKKDDGEVEPSEIKLGSSNEEIVIVKSGLKVGDVIAQNAMSYRDARKYPVSQKIIDAEKNGVKKSPRGPHGKSPRRPSGKGEGKPSAKRRGKEG